MLSPDIAKAIDGTYGARDISRIRDVHFGDWSFELKKKAVLSGIASYV